MNVSPKSPIIVGQQLTWSSLFNLIGGNRENTKYFSHDFHCHVCHCRGKWHSSIELKPPKECFYALEKINECILAGIEVLSSLTNEVSRCLVLRNSIENLPIEGRRYQKI